MRSQQYLIASVVVLALCAITAKADSIKTFVAAGTFQDGATLSGSLQIDITNGDVIGSTLEVAPDALGLDIIQGTGSLGNITGIQVGTTASGLPTLDLLLPVGSLVGYSGGLLGSLSNPLKRAGVDLQTNFLLPAHGQIFLNSGSLSPETATPEVATFVMIATGLLLIAIGRRPNRCGNLLAAIIACCWRRATA